MQLEQLATPVSVESPHRRYATLHRALERGMASDATWREMTEVCLLVGHRDEALLSYERIRDQRLRREAEHLLQRHGLLRRSADSDLDEVELPRSVKDDVVDATRVLFDDHMPLTTIVTTMTFPVVVGLGGFLTASTSSSFLFPAIAALPAMCVAGVVGGMSRRIMIDAARGLQDPPRIPQVRELSQQSGRFLLDALVLAAVFLGPAIALACVQGLSVSTLVAIALGAFLLPGAMVLRQLTDDWRALSPNHLFPAITRLRGDYATTAGVCALVAAPAALAAVLTAGSHLYLQASVVGPLAVAPLFFASRLLGLMVHGHREVLKDLLAPVVQPAHSPPQRVASPAPADPRAWRGDLARPTIRTTSATPPRVAAVPNATVPDRGPLPSAAPKRTRTVEAPPPAARAVAARPAKAAVADAGTNVPPAPAKVSPPSAPRPQAARAPQAAGASTPAPASTPRPAPREPHPLRKSAAVAAESSPPAARPSAIGARPAPTRMPSSTSAAPTKPAVSAPASEPPAVAQPTAASDAPAVKPRVAVTAEAPPDFTQLPGFNVVTGAARVLSGAASRAGGKRR